MTPQFSRQDARRCDKQHRADHGQQERGVECVVRDDHAAMAGGFWGGDHCAGSGGVTRAFHVSRISAYV